ncbi:MAG: hypothetical protein ACOX3U_00910 [Christensenellales bacterium]|jgi:ribosome-binding factor A
MSKVYDALYKKATGYKVKEEVREYDGEDELIKKKVIVKNVPPDTQAAKVYLEIDGGKKYIKMSVKELLEEADRIYKEIKELANGNK